MFGLVPTQYILSVNGQPTETLDAFLESTSGLKDGEYVRIKTVSFDGIPSVVSVKFCHHYWPTSVLVKSSEAERGWNMVEGSENLLQPVHCD
jgi:hypothetical protein